MAEKRTILAGAGYPMVLGANKIDGAYNFAVELKEGEDASLVLYKKGDTTPELEISFAEGNRIGAVSSLRLTGFQAKNYEYNFRINGIICQDPYAYRILGREEFGQPFTEDEHSVRCGFLSERSYNWEGDKSPGISYENMILYKLHVRGYTRAGGNEANKKGTFRGLKNMIPYWKSLGINAVELMPAYEFFEVDRPSREKGLVSKRGELSRVNFWGYTEGFYFAPKSSYCFASDSEKEVKDFIKALHQAGLECIMEFYFPYGTKPMTALKALHFWKIYYHVDGFHIIGDGVLAELYLKDPILAGSKLMMGGFDEGNLAAERKGSRNAALYTPEFMQDMRCFLKSDEGKAESAAYRIRRNSDCYAVINYMASQDGFTLADTVSYNYRHNEENGEGNHDGSSYNFSWNCGVEGPCKKLAVRQIRERQLRNAFLLLLLSQGVPMIYGGDEFGNSQDGNNNAYCQDNLIGWIDWKARRRNKKLLDFVKDAISFRKAHPILHMATELKGSDYMAKGHPDVSVHGERAWYHSGDNTSRLLGIMYNGRYALRADGQPDDMIYVAYNFHWESRTLALPNLPEGMEWKKVADTGEETPAGFFCEGANAYKKCIEVGPRTIVILTAKQEEKKDAPVAAL